MKSYPKYRSPETVEIENRIWPTRRIEKTPMLVPVDLRDGNQAFVNPMNVETKLKYFEMLCRIGFKEIEVAYPAASSEEFEFVRRLISENRIPDDVRIVVFTAARKDLIEKTMASIEGVRRAMIHCYIAGSELHREFVFGKTHEELIRITADSTRIIADVIAEQGLRGTVNYEFSPEEFSDSNTDFMVELCEAVRQEWHPIGKGDFILNLPSTVERRAPNEYADTIEYFCRKYSGMADTVISVHTHNDQGCGIAAAELAVLAGAERIEGTLSGHGERTGNMDLITFALNLKSRGVENGLDFSHLPEITNFIEGVSGIKISPRTPYAGELVFTAFSGTHQDAIRKGMARRQEISDYFQQGWKMPYLHLDPADIGRSYEGLIRINSQSGKGGVAYVLESVYGISVPKGMQPFVAKAVQNEAERTGKEVTASEIFRIFQENIVSPQTPAFELRHFRMHRPASADEKTVKVELEMGINGKPCRISDVGRGPIEAAVTAFRQSSDIPAIHVEEYHEHALGSGADARAIAFIGTRINGKNVYGTGIDESINMAAIRALVNALNHSRE